MNKRFIIDSIMNEDIIIAKIIDVPDFDNNEQIAKFIEKLKPGDKINNTIFDKETGEIFLSKNQKLKDYDIYSVPKKIRGQPVKPKKIVEDDPRKKYLSLSNLRKYYNFKHKGGGTYIIYRSDKKPFEGYDELNVSAFIDDLGQIDENAYQYRYDSTIDDFKSGERYYQISPIGLDKKFIVNNFNDYYTVKTDILKTFFEEYETRKQDYDMYDPDADIPQEIIKKDKSKFTKDDLEIIRTWLKTQEFGRAEVKLVAHEGSTKLDETNFLLTFPL